MYVLRLAAKFTINRFIPAKKQSNMVVNIELLNTKDKKWAGYCCYEGVIDGIKTFHVTLDVSDVAKCKERTYRHREALYELMRSLIHELIHVKQYATNQMYDYVNGNVRYDGKVYEDAIDYEAYWDNPWEIEAYGRTEGTLAMFLLKHEKQIKPRIGGRKKTP